MLSILGVLSLVLITVGITYVFFQYVKGETIENSITTGTVTFSYEEVEVQGATLGQIAKADSKLLIKLFNH